MTEKEIKNVQKAMEQCLNRKNSCNDCPLLLRTDCYKYIYKTVLKYIEGQQKAIKTLKAKLIKETEEVKPMPLFINACDPVYKHFEGYICSKCQIYLGQHFHYCPKCGGKIKWTT